MENLNLKLHNHCEPNSDDFFLSTVLQDFFVTLPEAGSFRLNSWLQTIFLTLLPQQKIIVRLQLTWIWEYAFWTGDLLVPAKKECSAAHSVAVLYKNAQRQQIVQVTRTRHYEK
jgi:hypothetical protein